MHCLPVIFIFAIAAGMLRADERVLLMEPVSHAFFAGETVELTLRPGEAWVARDGMVARLQLAGRTAWQQFLPTDPPWSLRVPMPELKAGSIVAAELLVTTASGEPVAHFPVQLFSRELGEGLQAALRELRIGTYAPAAPELAKFLAAIRIPHEPVADLHHHDRTWMICTGLDFDSHPGLAGDLERLLAAGVSVLVLPPYRGTMPLPAGLDLLASGEAHVTAIDKRLQPGDWTSASAPAAVGAAFDPLGNGTGVRFAASEGSWRWVEFRAEEATLIFCGFDLLHAHAASPAPGWLLLATLLPTHTRQR